MVLINRPAASNGSNCVSTHIRKPAIKHALMPGGKRRFALIQAFEAVLGKIGNRVDAFDVAAAQEAGDLMASRHSKGRRGELRDTMIAGIVLAQHAALATRNTAHFDDIPVTLINPWAS